MDACRTTIRDRRIDYESRCAELSHSWIIPDPTANPSSKQYGYYPAPDGSHCFVPMQGGVQIHD
jgi:hypothetical protein